MAASAERSFVIHSERKAPLPHQGAGAHHCSNNWRSGMGCTVTSGYRFHDRRSISGGREDFCSDRQMQAYTRVS